jgi:ATP phosphoribosyltransferase
VSAPLIIAIPSKGRLQKDSVDYFARAGLEIVQAGNARSYRGSIKGVAGVEIAFLSAPEIAREIGAGAVHLGVTGRDQVEESVTDWKVKADFTAGLGFGRCDVIVAVPEAWIDVETMEDLDDVAAEFHPRHGRRLTVATKYVNLTRRFFAGHGIADYRIVESLGATEGAPATGAADLIVDITTTGATLRDNGLKILDDGVIIRSQAYLVTSLAAEWEAAQLKTLSAILVKTSAKDTATKKLVSRIEASTR